MNSQDYIEANPIILMREAKRIIAGQQTDDATIELFKADHPEAISSDSINVNTAILLGWLGY